MSSEADTALEVDAFGEAAAEVGKGGAAATAVEGAEGATAAPAVAGPGGPWPANGKKYPNALDYINDENAQRYNEWLDVLSGQPGLAHKTLVGESMHATFVYYGSQADVHPLVQLGMAGTFFGIAYAVGRARAKPVEEAAKKAEDEKRAKELAAALEGGE